MELGPSEPSEAPAESRIEVNSLLKELLRESIIVCSELAQMPEAVLIGAPGI